MTRPPSLPLALRTQALRALALNRTPGLHFLGNFLDVFFERVSREDTCLRLPAGPQCLGADGRVHAGPLCLLTDLALAATVRAPLPPETRLGTVSLQMQFTGVPWTGPLEAQARLDGFVTDSTGRLGHTRADIRGADGVICHAAGSFMALDPPEGKTLAPVPHRRQDDATVAPLPEAALTKVERDLLVYVDRAIARMGTDPTTDFTREFFGFDTVPETTGASGLMRNGPHVGNRVGHVQGGVSFGFALATAQAALGSQWRVSNITASYISAGQGRMLRARSRIVHLGRRTAVVRTRVTGLGRRIVLEVLSNHLRGAEA